MKNQASFRGILRGCGYEASCSVMATQVAMLGSNTIRLVDHSIAQVSRELPDGLYTLSVNDENIRMIRRNGAWITAGPV